MAKSSDKSDRDDNSKGGSSSYGGSASTSAASTGSSKSSDTFSNDKAGGGGSSRATTASPSEGVSSSSTVSMDGKGQSMGGGLMSSYDGYSEAANSMLGAGVSSIGGSRASGGLSGSVSPSERAGTLDATGRLGGRKGTTDQQAFQDMFGGSFLGAGLGRGTFASDAYRDMAESMRSVGVTGLGGGLAPSAYRDAAQSMLSQGVTSIGGATRAPDQSYRQSEIASMKAFDGAGGYVDKSLENTLLDTIADYESGRRFDVRYDGTGRGATITDFTDHPRTGATITTGPNKGQKSTAAGGLQINAPTWDEFAAKAGVKGKGFTEEMQRAVGLQIAKETYAAKTGGRSLQEDLRTSDPKRIGEIASVLSGRWEALGKVSPEAFAEKFQQNFNNNFLGKTNTTTTLGAVAGYRDPVVSAAGNPTSPSVERFGEKYLGGNTAPPVAVIRPEAKPELSLGQKVVAGGIDLVGGALVPVAGIANAGLSLFGQPTIGEMLVSGIGSGDWGDMKAPDQLGQGSDRDPVVPKEEAKDKKAPGTPTSTERFVSRYLRTDRLTPAQKWGGGLAPTRA